MTDFLLWAGGVIFTAIFGLIGWFAKMIFGKFKDHEEIHSQLVEDNRILDKKLDDHKLHVAENYAPKNYIEKMEDRLVALLIRIEDKLDKKQDKE